MFSFLKSDKAPDGKGAKDLATAPAGPSLAARLRQSLAATRARFGKQISALLTAGRGVDETLFEELETILLSCDVGVAATQRLIEATQQEVRRAGLTDAGAVRDVLRNQMLALLTPLQQPLAIDREKPFVILLAGVNGAGKTTTIGKLTKMLLDSGRTVLLAAGDTFRAAAEQQLRIWAERNEVTVIAQEGGDAAAVIYDAVQSAKAKGTDVVLADTAGRLPTQLHLMEELKKVKRVITKALPSAPHEVLLVLDANTGQNAVAQVKAFDDALGVTGLILTKLDGTAKGGAIAAIAQSNPIPVRFVGTGEGIDDLRPFDAGAFVDALFA